MNIDTMDTTQVYRESYAPLQASEQGEGATQERLRPKSWDELLKLPKRKYVIKHLLDTTAMSVVYGQPNCGKTFVALGMAFNVALGEQWQDRRVNQGAVVYIATEGGLGIIERVQAFLQYHGIENLPDFYVIPESIDLRSSEADAQTLINQINEIGDVSLVIVDTLARAIAGGNENAPEDMGAFVDNCDRIRMETGAHLSVIHHSGKDTSQGARGHSSLKGATDTEIEISKSQKDLVMAEVHKQRDGKNGDVFTFDLKQVELGTDDDGDSITSCVAVESDRPVKDRGKQLSDRLQRALDILNNTLCKKGEVRKVMPEMEPVNCVPLKDYRQALRDYNFAEGDTEEAVRKAIYRVITELKNKGLAGAYNDYIWNAGH